MKFGFAASDLFPDNLSFGHVVYESNLVFNMCCRLMEIELIYIYIYFQLLLILFSRYTADLQKWRIFNGCRVIRNIVGP